MKYDVFGMGNALMDFLVEVDHNKLKELNLNHGQFHLIDDEGSRKLLKELEKYNIQIAPGGSSANTIHGISILGGNTVFCGKVGKDKHGNLYEENMKKENLRPLLTRSEKLTGHAITFITPEGERTFVVNLGAALHQKKSDIFLEDLKNSNILHIEGYLLENKDLREVAVHAMQFAKKNNIKVSIDLGDPGMVARNKPVFYEIIEKYADIVFANEDEAKALTGLESEEALNEISKLAEITVVKIGLGGSLIKKRNIIEKIPLYKANTLDMTGAGDMYAAAFLYGLTRNLTLKTCGHLGSYFAAIVVEQIGARLKSIDKNEIKQLIENIN